MRFSTRILPRLGLRAKLTVIITLPMLAIVGVLLVLLGWIQIDQAKDSMVEYAEALVHAMNQSLERVYLSQDQRQTADVIDWLQSFPDIRRVCGYDRQGEVFFSYVAHGESATQPVLAIKTWSDFADGRLAIWRPLVSGERELGLIFLELSSSRLTGEVRNTMVTLGAISATVVSLGLLIALSLQRRFSKPILDLQQTAEHVAQEEDFSVRAIKQTHDEIGRLVDTFNYMLSRVQASDEALREANRDLEQRVQLRTREIAAAVGRLESEIEEHQNTQRQREALYRDMMTASRQAGMAEVATGILHNVGNVLNSVNVSASVVMEKVRGSQAAGLQKVCELIDQNGHRLHDFLTNDAKGKQLRPFLKLLADKMIEERDEVIGEVRGLADNIEHIKEIVNLQQSLSKACTLREPVSLPELVENAIKINDAGLHRHGVELIREYDAVPELVAEKHKILQILVNLISNAKYAVSAVERPDRKLWLRIHRYGEDRVVIDVTDNGIGISRNNLTKIFTRGFTTKQSGHGFGLHSSALAAKDMGGQIVVTSDGPARGATFRLELPIVYDHNQGKSVVPEEVQMVGLRGEDPAFGPFASQSI